MQKLTLKHILYGYIFKVIDITCKSFICFFIITQAIWAADNNNPPLVMRGADINDVSRVVFDEIPKNAYRVVPFNNKIKIIFDNFQYNFLEQDLLSIGLLKNIKKLSVDVKDTQTILNIDYSCACQGDFYKWYNKKLVLDVYGLDAVANPLKHKTAQQLAQKQKNHTTDEAPSKKDENIKEIDKVSSKNNAPKKIVLKEENFKDYLQSLVKSANEQGLVQYKNNATAQKQEAQTDKSNTQKKAASNIPKKEISSKSKKLAKQKKLAYPLEPENLLPTDKKYSYKIGTCLPDSAFKLPANDPEFDNFYDKVSDYRYNLIGEFDNINADSALQLAYHYISYGLGEEALQVLKNFPVPEHRGYIARSMAELLTNMPLNQHSAFKNIDKCSGTQSLWAAYRYYKTGNEVKAAKLSNFAHAADILKTFPVVLQRQIGSSLALNLVRQNSYASALELINVLAHNTSQFNPSVLLVRGLIDAKNGLHDHAIKVLESVMDKTQGIDQHLAGLALSELKLAANIELTQRDISILEEIVFLKQRELIGIQALSLIAENESRYHNFDMAFKRLSLKKYNNPQIKDPAQIKAEQLFKRIAVSGEVNDNPKSFNIYWLYSDLIPDNPIYLKAFAQKLYDNGYDYAAIKVLKDIQKKFPKLKQDMDIIFLLADAFYRQGYYIDTVAVLNQSKKLPPEYIHLKADALNAIGQYQAAFTSLKDLKDKKSITLRAEYALNGDQWLDVKKTYDQLENVFKNPELYYRAKASAYMGGYQYPGTANDYKKSEDIVFHQADYQAKNVEDVVQETKKLLQLINKRSQKITHILHEKYEDLSSSEISPKKHTSSGTNSSI